MQVGKLKVKVLSMKGAPKVVSTYGNDLEVQECIVADETGKIKLVLWGTHIASFSKQYSIYFYRAFYTPASQHVFNHNPEHKNRCSRTI